MLISKMLVYEEIRDVHRNFIRTPFLNLVEPAGSDWFTNPRLDIANPLYTNIFRRANFWRSILANEIIATGNKGGRICL